MRLQLLLDAPLAVQLHLATVMPAFVIGTWLLFVSKKGARWHRRLGYVYLGMMTATALITAFIRSSGGWSLLHLFIPLTLTGVVGAIAGVRSGNIRAHRQAMLGLYVGAILIAGSLAVVLPGRLMHRLVFG